MSGEPALEVDSLGTRVGARWIVEAISFQAKEGEITAVIGPNGAGKTTLLETVAGLISFDANRNPTKPAVILQIKDGEQRFVSRVSPEDLPESVRP